MHTINLGRGYVALVDDANAELAAGYHWTPLTINARLTYAAAKRGAASVLLHRLIVGADPSMDVDHVDGDGLNCQRANLRVCTKTQNQGNRRKNRNGSSRFKGVGWHRGARKWRARITDAGKVREIGLFVSDEDAARAYDAAARDKFGTFAAVNFPCDGERSALAP